MKSVWAGLEPIGGGYGASFGEFLPFLAIFGHFRTKNISKEPNGAETDFFLKLSTNVEIHIFGLPDITLAGQV